MKRLTVITIAALSGAVGFALVGQSGTLAAGESRTAAGEARQVDKLPQGMLGFRGMFAGKLVSKDVNRGTFVLSVTKMLRTWKESKAKDPQSAVGKSLNIELDPKSRFAEEFNKVLRALRPGDLVDVEAFSNAEGRLIVMEWFKKADGKSAAGADDESPAERPAGKPAGVARSEEPPDEQDLPKDGRIIARGRVTGTVVAKGAWFVDVKSESGRNVRFRPRWIDLGPQEGGGYEKRTLEAIARLREGDRVSIIWYANEHVRIQEIQPAR